MRRCKTVSDKYWFDCPGCEHTFESILSDIQNGGWCGYCASNRLCDKDDCNSCFKKSFASNEKAGWWSEKNGIKPRDVFTPFNISNADFYNLSIFEDIPPSTVIRNSYWKCNSSIFSIFRL